MAICCFFFRNPKWCVFGLAIIAVGSGLFLPSITPLFGEIYPKHDQVGREVGFTSYYLAKNFGVLLAPIVCGYIATTLGYHYAFLLTGVVMISGVLVFYLGHSCLPNIASRASQACRLLPVALIYLGILLSIPLMYLLIRSQLDGVFLICMTMGVAIYLFVIARAYHTSERKKLLQILLILSVVVIFSAFLGQGGTTLNLFIERIIDRHIAGHLIPTAEFYALDPLFMLTIGPIFAMFVMRYARRHQKTFMMEKLIASLVILSLGFVVLYVAAARASHTGHAFAGYIVLTYFVFPMGELLIFPTVLSAISRLAPANLLNVTMGLFMFSQGVAGYFIGQISQHGKINFPLNNIAHLKQASFQYAHFFAAIALTLLGIAVGIGIARLLFVRLFQIAK